MKKDFEGVFWNATVIYSNRFNDRIEFTRCSSDRTFVVPQHRAEATIKDLESGASPDEVIKKFPVEEYA